MANMLVIGPHPDDAEIGMGGTVAALAAQGHDVLLLDLTDGCPTPVGDRETRLREAEEARQILSPAAGPGKVRRVLLDLPNRTLTHTVEARHRVAGVIRAHQASILFMPHPEDAHPDHVAATRIGEDARFDAKLTKMDVPVPRGLAGVGPPIYSKWVFYYFCSHLRTVPRPTFIFDTSAFAGAKRRAVEAYRSQFAMNPVNAGYPERLAQQDGYLGSRIGAAAGEPFWCREPLGLGNLASLGL